ncbi:MAG: nucleotidyltransferase family protein [Gammaproteobacteria bacterium]|nr:nucleotidyltransferase family protein [Gammaproteobacteria bacterium]
MPNFFAAFPDICIEDKIIVCAARTEISDVDQAVLKSLSRENVDWNIVFQKAGQHKVQHLVYWQLNKVAADIIPWEIQVSLKQDFSNHVFNNLKLTSELIKLLELCKANNIRVVPIKGPMLAQIAYKNLSLRSFSDLDFFVSKEGALKIKDLLVARSFRLNGLNETANNDDFFYEHALYELAFLSADKTVAIDLTWNIEAPAILFTVPEDFIAENLINIELNGYPVPSFSCETLFLILNIHTAKHYWTRLCWVCDIHEFMRSFPNIDLDAILHRAARLKIKNIILTNLLIINWLYDFKLPESVMDLIANNRTVKKHAQRILDHLLSRSHLPNMIYEMISSVQLRDSLLLGVKDFLLRLMSPTLIELSLIKLPKCLFPLYWIIRPVYLAVRRVRNYFI